MALGISEAVELTRTIADLARKGVTIDLQERIMELREAVLNVREELLSVREENSQLKQQIASKATMVFDKELEHYWGGDGDTRDGPFCSRCFDAEGKTIRLRHAPSHLGSWRCPECKNSSGPKHSPVLV